MLPAEQRDFAQGSRRLRYRKHRTAGGGLPGICREPAADLRMRCIRLDQGPLRSPSPSQPPISATPSGQKQMSVHL